MTLSTPEQNSRLLMPHVAHFSFNQTYELQVSEKRCGRVGVVLIRLLDTIIFAISGFDSEAKQQMALHATLLWYSVLFTVESLSLLYLLVVS